MQNIGPLHLHTRQTKKETLCGIKIKQKNKDEDDDEKEEEIETDSEGIKIHKPHPPGWIKENRCHSMAYNMH